MFTATNLGHTLATLLSYRKFLKAHCRVKLTVDYLTESCPGSPGRIGEETGTTASSLQGVFHQSREGKELPEAGQALVLGQSGLLLLQAVVGLQQGLLDAPQPQLLPEENSLQQEFLYIRSRLLLRLAQLAWLKRAAVEVHHQRPLPLLSADLVLAVG